MLNHNKQLTFQAHVRLQDVGMFTVTTKFRLTPVSQFFHSATHSLYRLGVSQAHKAQESGDERLQLRAL